jgi:ABC-type uncharacterized transport system substrate-binding protein
MWLNIIGPIVLLALGILVAPPAAVAQPRGTVARVGVLCSGSEALFLPPFREGIRVLDSIAGRNSVIEVRAADGVYDRLPGLVAELIALKVDVIVTAGIPAALAAQRATTTIPIVASNVGDPVGLVQPGGHIAALSHSAADLSAKQVELFKEAIPTLARIGVLYNPTNPLHPGYWQETQAAAQALGLLLVRLEVRDTDELVHAFDAGGLERGDGLLVLADAFFNAQAAGIAQLATTHRLPMMAQYREFVEAGGLLAYGPNLPEIAKRAATYVDKILKGAKPADLPVDRPMKFELIINLKTAQALGINIPQALLDRADEVIQ